MDWLAIGRDIVSDIEWTIAMDGLREEEGINTPEIRELRCTLPERWKLWLQELAVCCHEDPRNRAS